MRQLRFLIVAGALHHHHELALALVLVSFHLRQQAGQVTVEHGLEQLGQLAGQHRRALAAEIAAMSASDSAIRCEDS